VLTPEEINQLTTGLEPDDETASALLSLALQQAFCGQFGEALYYLNLWPEASKYPGATRKKVTAAFGEAIKQEYPDRAERLLSPSGVATAPIRSSAEPIGWWLQGGKLGAVCVHGADRNACSSSGYVRGAR
jgi:hypothetical protein